MKYAIVIPDGAADVPQEGLGGRTPLEAARTPHMDRLAHEGVAGLVRTIPQGYAPGSDVAIMSVLGYDPARYYTGRAPLEAASMGVALSEGDWAARANLVTVTDGRMADYSAGHITSEEAREVMATLGEAFAGEGLEFYPGKSYRNLMVMRGAGDLSVETTPPHDIAGREVKDFLPGGRDGERFRRIMARSAELLRDHPVNARRRASGKAEATTAWLWGEGRAAAFPAFRELHGISAAVITYVDLVAGICALSGWERIAVPGATGYIDTDYAGKGAAGIEALERHDLVLVHVEAPDEASHNGDAAAKVGAIEDIDRHVVGPLWEALGGMGEYRMLVLPDHYTLVGSGAHGGGPVPFAAAGLALAASGASSFSESEAAGGELMESGVQLMRAFLGKAEKWAL